MGHANLAPVSENQEGSDTTYFLAADRDGNAVSWIQSVFHGFGASWAIPGTGILMNNRLTGFSLDEKSPNVIAPPSTVGTKVTTMPGKGLPSIVIVPVTGCNRGGRLPGSAFGPQPATAHKAVISPIHRKPLDLKGCRIWIAIGRNF